MEKILKDTHRRTSTIRTLSRVRTHQTQVCTECGFAIEIMHKLVDVEFSTVDNVLKELKKNE